MTTIKEWETYLNDCNTSYLQDIENALITLKRDEKINKELCVMPLLAMVKDTLRQREDFL